MLTLSTEIHKTPTETLSKDHKTPVGAPVHKTPAETLHKTPDGTPAHKSRTYVAVTKPVDIPSLPVYEINGSTIKDTIEDMPSIFLSQIDIDKARANFANALITRFSRVRPKHESIRNIVNGHGDYQNMRQLEC